MCGKKKNTGLVGAEDNPLTLKPKAEAIRRHDFIFEAEAGLCPVFKKLHQLLSVFVIVYSAGYTFHATTNLMAVPPL